MLTFLLACAEPAATPAPTEGAMDLRPARRTVSPDGSREAIVHEGGTLDIRAEGAEVTIDTLVDPRVAFSPDGKRVVYARDGEWGETDLWSVTLPSTTPERLTDTVGSEDRPVFSPDGRRVAFVSGRTGIASWWVLDLDTSAVHQVTNVGVSRGRPGEPPAGFVPVPDGLEYRWTEAGLSWVAEGVRYEARP